MPQTDTLRLDTLLTAQWRADSDYNYDRELLHQDQDLFSRLMRSIEEFLRSLDKGTADIQTWIYIICAFIILGLVVWFLIKNKGALFFSDQRTGDGYSIEEDNIYGVDFDAVRKKALAKGNYREAIRMTYLQALKHLSDNNLINWQIYKTPTQYAKEFTNSYFANLTRVFLRVRYGNFEATAADCDECERWRGDIMNIRKEVGDEG